ncbi:hypothetical protein SBADM41S_00014 [Streptomyces badius]
MDATKSDGWRVGAEFVDGLGKAFCVQTGGFAVGSGLVDALAPVGDDQSDERAAEQPEGFTGKPRASRSSFAVESSSWKSSSTTRP